MITDKDREWAIRFKDTLEANGIRMGDFNMHILDEEMKSHRTESAEQASKEAAYRFCATCHGKEDGMCGECPDRAAILGETVKEGKTDAEKLDIAVKALKSIYEMLKCDGVIRGR